MAKTEQLGFESVLEHSFKQRHRRIERFIEKNRFKYIASAQEIVPDLQSNLAIWSRLDFIGFAVWHWACYTFKAGGLNR